MEICDKLTCREIVRLAGGPAKIGEAASKRDAEIDAQKMEWAAQKWRQNGIPDTHWDLMIELAGVTVDQLYQANKLVRKGDEQPAPIEAAE